MKARILTLASLLILPFTARAATSTWEITGLIDSVNNGGTTLENGDTFVIRFRVNTSTPGVVTPPDPTGTSTGTFTGALSNIVVSTFPVGPNLNATSGDVVQTNTTTQDFVSYSFDSADGVSPASLNGQPFNSATLSFATTVLTPNFPGAIRTPDQVFGDPNLTHLTITWGTGTTQIRAQGHVTNLARVLVLIPFPTPGGVLIP